jgi:hypothetical protein
VQIATPALRSGARVCTPQTQISEMVRPN